MAKRKTGLVVPPAPKKIPLIDTLYTVESLAEELQVQRDSVYRYVKQGRLKGTMIGRRWRFSEENVRKFLNGE